MKYTLLTNGRRLAYQTAGRSRHAIPLMLLHGFCEDQQLWAPLLPHLKSARLLSIDLPGFGGSDLPLASGMDVYAEAVCAVLNERGIERCVLAGHSMGGYTALAFARHFPERLSGLGLIHSHPFADDPVRKENRRRGIELLQAGKKDAYVAQLFPGLFAPAFAQQHPKIVEAVIARGRRQPAAGIIAALEGMMDRPDSLEILHSLRCPALMVLGEEDSIIPPNEALRTALRPI
jgi:3-oxoadipate enol-lactonase